MIKAWDLPTRFFHWLVVLLVILSWVSAKYGDSFMVWHQWNGYFLLILIISRIVWGRVGSTTSRFSRFISNPQATVHYLLGFMKGNVQYYLSHNPLGGWMVVLVLTLLLTQSVTGLFSSDEILAEGPLSSLVSSETVKILTSYHLLGFNLILVMVGLHLFAVIYHQVIKKESIIQAMITGYKPDQLYVDHKKLYWSSWKLALSILLVVTSIFITIISFF